MKMENFQLRGNKIIKQKKKFIRFICILILLAALITAAVFAHEYFDGSSSPGQPVTVTIREGSGTQDIADMLKTNKIIKSKTLFKLKVRNMGYGGSLNYGTFELNTGMCLKEVIETLVNTPAKPAAVTVTVPEGYSAENIAVLFAKKGLCTEEEFLNALSEDYDYAFIKDIPDGAYNFRLQGFLFPNTYEFLPEASAHDYVNTMLGEFEKQFGELTGKKTSDDIFELVTIASLVEREAKIDSERAVIAGVIKNRLAAGMKLQVDATVIYPITDGRYDIDTVLFSHLETDSPYNTYMYEGLPAGPICSPGYNALLAAYKPDKNDYLYYHTDEEKKDGSHIFTKTFEEHQSTMN